MIDEAAKTKLRILVDARIKRDEAKKVADEAEKAFREAEADVYEAIEDSDQKGTIKVDLGDPWGVVSFKTRETIYAKIIKGMEDELQEHFERRALVDEYTGPSFKKGNLNALAREVYEAGGDFPPGLSYYANRGVTITRQKG